MYSLARNLLFRFSGETAHELALDGLSAAERLGVLPLLTNKMVQAPVEVMGIRFPNAVGLAAGLDKNADHLDAMGALGFGFVEVGTVTPKAQPGNPKPRIFRIPEKGAIINRMGFNNKGVHHLVEQVKQRRYSGVLGINVGKNLSTSVEDAEQDYLYCLKAVYEHADYITVNISSPNTPGLRNLQFGETLESLLRALKTEQTRLSDLHQRYVPIAIKIAPDMSDDEVRLVAGNIRNQKMDAVIATNTTLERAAVQGLAHADEAGGLSGKPVREKSTHVIRLLADSLEGDLPIIGVGGIDSAQAACEKIEAGASLVQVYTGFIYEGPALIKDAAEAIAALQARRQ
ncbi:dihydroorotate oxidase A [Oceanospirillum multiglobuliferum]|uniref:Dihydroorotate dehydrogenase (quinone) n=1 Tax=Oceanospirillum multiglobuliferum TaxID=64969 RepID=A0A1T4LDM8_9GAMM|nr:quinone-dependent dihydroorotate dehydrogenase [Oceanospirillum multiglobuliferum]OPX56695.1 dihydroorotate dehydrogenase (quinone) [Oceanospirillum multiglobuliferum]SJZ52773.1 dihydroorotate oxidase A [Oceanospirillum multiglobuliferum]